MLGQARCVNLQNLHASILIGQGDLNLAVQAARAQQRRVQDVGAVGGHDHLDLQTHHVKGHSKCSHMIGQQT